MIEPSQKVVPCFEVRFDPHPLEVSGELGEVVVGNEGIKDQELDASLFCSVSQVRADGRPTFVVGEPDRVFGELVLHFREAIDTGDFSVFIIGHGSIYPANGSRSLYAQLLRHVKEALGISFYTEMRLFSQKNHQALAGIA